MKKFSKRGRLIVFVLFIILAIIFLIEIVNAYTNVSECGILSTPGETYQLNKSISATVTCLTINANVKLENYGKIELLDAFMTYWIIDKNNSLISEVKDTRSVIDKTDFDILIKVPKSTSSGTYRLYVQITYLENKTAIAGESFEVMEENYCKPLFSLMDYLPFILIGFGFFVIFILIIVLSRKFHHAKNRKKIKRFIKKPIPKKKRRKK